MKKCFSALLLIILLTQALSIDAFASIGRVLTDDELDRAYALTGLGQGDGLYHNGMAPNASMSGMQLAYWLEDRLDNQLHNIDDLLARARYQMDVLKEKYPTVHRVLMQSPHYGQIQALGMQAEDLRQDMNYQLERLHTDINMIAEMRARLQDSEASLFDSDRVRASARIETAAAELVKIRDYIKKNASKWDTMLLQWTNDVRFNSDDGTDAAVTASLRGFLESLWKKFNLGEGSDEAVEAELRKLLKAQFLQYAPGSEQTDAFADDAIALMREMMQQYDPDGEIGMTIIREIQSLMKQLYEKYGTEGSDDEALMDDIHALMRDFWEKFGPDSEINKAFTAAWGQLMRKYGVDGDAIDAFSAEMRAMLEDLWNKYGPDGESKDELLDMIKKLWQMYREEGKGNGISEWLSSLFISQSQPVSNSAPVTAFTPSNSRASRLSAAAGVRSNDVDAHVTVITKNEVCLAFVVGKNQQRENVSGVNVRVRDATKPNAPLADYTSKDGMVIMPSNMFVADKYDRVHMYVEVDPRAQGYRNYIIEDLDVVLGQTYLDVLVPIGDAAVNGGVASNAGDMPYIVSGSFNGKDIMHSEYEMIYSPANKKEFTVKAVVKLPEGEQYPDLMFSWYENEGGFKSIQKHWAEATTKRTTPEGYVEYTFKGAWKKKFTPNASDEQRPTFSFGKGDDALSFPTQLVALRSATDTPLNEGTGAEGGVYANVLENGFSMSFTIPTVDVNVSLNLPFLKYMPHLSIDPGGFVTAWIGCPIMEDELEDSVLNWENRDMKEFRMASEWIEKETWFANYKAQFGLASDFYREKKLKFMAQSSIEVGIFAVGSGRWELDNDDPDVKRKNIALKTGFGFTACYEFSWTISYPIGPVPAYVCFTLGVCAGVSVQFVVNFTWANGGFEYWKIFPVDEITYSISFYFAAQVGIGVKGFLEAWVRFIASLDVSISFVLFGLDKCSTVVSGGYELSTGLTVFFVSFRKTWISKEKVLFSTIPADNNLLDHYMGAEKNAAKNGGKVVEAAHLDPQSYPELSPETSTHLTRLNAKASFNVIEINNATFAFYIAPGMDKNGKTHQRVSWDRIDQLEEQASTQAAIDAYLSSLNGYDDYAFDVYEKDGLVYLAVACAAKFNGDGLPEPNEGITDRKHCNQIFYLLILKPDSKGNLTHKLDKGYYTRTDKDEDHFLVSGEPVGTYTERRGSYSETVRYYYDSIATPEITWAKATRRSNKVLGIELFGTFGRVAYSEDDPAYGVTSFEMITGNALKCFNDKYVQSGMGKGYVRTNVRGAMRCSDTEPKIHHQSGINELHSPSFVALSQRMDGTGDRAIEVFDFEMNSVVDMTGREAVVLEKGDIQHFELAQTAVDGDGKNYRRMIFYTEKETNDDGVDQCRLFGLYLEPVVRDDTGITFTATKYAYDLVIPDGQFRLTYMGETPYIYWLSAMPDPDRKDENKWRVWIVAFDMATNAMTDASVFAEFSLPIYQASFFAQMLYRTVKIKDTRLHDLMLMGNGRSYFTIVPNEIPKGYEQYLPSPMALCSFTELMKPVVNLEAAITQAPAVSAGNYEDISLALMNSGNMGVSTFDVAMYEVTDGKEGSKPVETVHVNCVEPEKSKITMRDGKLEMTGIKVAHRAEDFDYTARQRDWVLSQEKKAYRVKAYGTRNEVESVKTLDSDTQYVKSEVLMPGSVGVYNTAFLIPESWRGKKTLRFKLTKLSVRSNLARLAGNAANGEASDLLTYVLDEDTGNLMLEPPAQSNGLSANAIRTGLFANATKGSTLDLELNVHDLSVSHRVYRGWDGEKWLDIILHNYAAFGDNPKLSCAVYVDGATDPYYVDLPYFENALASRATQTVSMPFSALVDDPSAHSRARVEVTVVGREDGVPINNEFTVYLGGSDALRFIDEPEDTTVQEGEDVVFEVEVTGGARPYTYQWQIWDPIHEKWVDLPGFTEATMRRKDIEKKWDGCRFRCVVTDAEGTQIITQEFTLTVRDRVPTGDNSNLPLYLAVALAALALLWLVRRRIKHS